MYVHIFSIHVACTQCYDAKNANKFTKVIIQRSQSLQYMWIIYIYIERERERERRERKYWNFEWGTIYEIFIISFQRSISFKVPPSPVAKHNVTPYKAPQPSPAKRRLSRTWSEMMSTEGHIPLQLTHRDIKRQEVQRRAHSIWDSSHCFYHWNFKPLNYSNMLLFCY